MLKLKSKITWVVFVVGLVIIAGILTPVTSQSSSVREYWIKAEEILWDYALTRVGFLQRCE